MPHVPFVHLHNRTEYSLLNSALRVTDLVRLAAENKMTAVALTDRMNLHAGMAFYNECYRNGVKPILGAEIALEPVADVVSVDPRRPAAFDVVVLAEDNMGYERLCELLTRIHLESPEHTRLARREWFEELAGHWIVLSGGMEGEVFQALVKDDEASARKAAGWLAHAAGPGKFYIELQWHELPSERTVLPKLIELAKQLNIPTVATNQCMYAVKEDARALELLRRIEQGTTVNSLEELTPESDMFYFRGYEEIAHAFRNVPEAMKNTVAIADQCAVELAVGKGYLTPHFEPPEGKSGHAYLEELCRKGLEKRYPDWKDEDAETPRKLTKKKRKELEKRLKYEIDTIAEMGFVSYFLIVADFVAYARREGIPVGPGRGSAAGSLVSYLLGITDVDPLDFGLLFERFLNPSRKKMPDIDMDFCERRRDEVIEYVREKYGRDKVAQIATFSTLRYRAALRETGRILNAPRAKVERLCMMLSDFERAHEWRRRRVIAQALERHDALRDVYLHDRAAKDLLDLAVRIEDMPRNLSTHAAGVVISPKPLRTIVPLTKGSDDDILTQFDMYAVERLGLLKMDFLGLTTLTIINDTIELIKQTSGTAIDVAQIPFTDEPTYVLLQQGDVLGVFQLEKSAGMRRLVQDLRPTEFNDLIAALSLYRPGAMQGRDAYVARKHGREAVTYLHPKLEPILKDTYGIMVYQEQVMQALHALAGYTLAEADTFRQIMSKKLHRMVDAERAKFMAGAKKRGIESALAEELFGRIEKFAGYGFNKSHATAYAVVAYWTAWLKAHYPAEFFVALLNSKIDTPEKFAECSMNCKARGIPVLLPDVNKSLRNFSVEHEADSGATALRYGLEAIRNVGPTAASALVREREEHGPYKGIDDLTRRVDHRAVNRKACDSLVKAGACDSFALPRQRMCLIVDDAATTWERSGESELQRSFFESFDDQEQPQRATRVHLDSVGEWDLLTRLAFEKEMLGIYVSGHPLDRHAATWRALVTADSRSTGYTAGDDARFSTAGADVIMGGLLVKADWRTSKKGRAYGVLTLEDMYGTFDVLLWSDLVERYRETLEPGQVWFIIGSFRTSFGKTTLSANKLSVPEESLAKWPRRLRVSIGPKSGAKANFEKLAELLKKSRGALPVELLITDSAGEKSLVGLPADAATCLSEQLLGEIEDLFGEGSVSCVISVN